MSSLGERLKEPDLEEMLTHSDLNRDGQIDYEKWISLIMSI